MVVLLWKHTYTRPISHQEPDGARSQKCGQVTAKAQLLLHPEPKGDVARARGTPGTASRRAMFFFCFSRSLYPFHQFGHIPGISVEKIIEIHQFMVARMQKVLTEFLMLDQDQPTKITPPLCSLKSTHIKRKGTIAPKVGKDTVDWRDEPWWRDAKYDWILVKRHTVQIPVFKLAVIWTSMHL